MKRNIGNRPIQRAKVDGFLLIEIDDGRLLRIAIAIGGEQLADGPVSQIKLVTTEYVRQFQSPFFLGFSPARRFLSHLRDEPDREPLDDPFCRRPQPPVLASGSVQQHGVTELFQTTPTSYCRQPTVFSTA